MKILVVEDQIDLQEELVYFLCRIGHEAAGISSGIELDQAMMRDTPDLLLLDVGLPGEDGISIARRLAGIPQLSIVMLTARSGEEDRIRSFEGGADSYLVKPVNYRELQAILARAHQRLGPVVASTSCWQLKRRERLLNSPSGGEISLTGVEVCLLETMLRRAGKAASKRELIEAMGHDYFTFDMRRIEVRISRLRKKIRSITSSEDPVQSEWGVGYAFVSPCELT